MEKAEKLLSKYFWIVIILLSIPASWALFVPGFYGASDDLHIAWLQQMHQTITSGKIPPRFVPNLSFDFGYPLFNFVFPLPFYIAELIHLLGFSFVDSIKLLFFLTIPLSGIFMYFLLRSFSGPILSLAGAILYVYTPYRSVDIYIRGAIGEIVSFVFLPLLLLSAIKLTENGEGPLNSKLWIGVCSLSFASLVLSHNITSFMFFPFLIFLIILRIFFIAKNKGLTIKRIFMSIILGLLISGYFWIPAIVESPLMKYDTVFNFADHFPTIKQLITPYWGYGASVPGPYDGMSFFLGMANIAVFLLGVVLFLIHFPKFTKHEKVLLIWSMISLMIVAFLMNYRSSYFWQRLPFFPYFQFPWRFLILTTLIIPTLFIGLKYSKFSKILSLCFIIFTLISASNYFKPQDFLGRQDEYFINRYIPSPQASADYLTTGEEYLRLPKNTEYRPDKNYPLVLFDGEIKNMDKLNSLDMLLSVSSENGGILNYNKYFFPGWTAQLNGKQIPIMAGKPFGQIIIQIPRGLHSVRITFEETIFKKILDLVSLISLFVALGLIFRLNLLNRLKSGRIKYR